jgi:hypothetical protein
MRRTFQILILLMAPRINPVSLAFKIESHRDITAQALLAVSPGFSAVSVTEILDANECVDFGVRLFTDGDEFDKPCLPAVWHSSQAYDQQFHAPEDHFDNEYVLQGMARLRMLKTRVVRFSTEGHYIEARKLLGMALHTVQDFYAHSNWVELRNQKTFAALDSLDGNIRLSSNEYGDAGPAFRLAGSKEDVCVSTWQIVAYQGVAARVKVVQTGNLAKNATENVLTTGYWFDSPPDPMVAKCLHGLVNPGINKDDTESHHGPLYYNKARQLATEHTRQFVQDCLDALRGNPKALSGLTTEASQVSATPRPGEGGFGYLKVEGAKMNKAFDVKFGDVYQFKASGTVTWGWNNSLGIDLGITGALMGKASNPMSSGPEGAPGISSRTYMNYRIPSEPKVNVGALIGSIYDPACPYEGKTADNSACEPTARVVIGAGRRPTDIPATGTLYLHVNDANLSNNQGYFDVSFTLVAPGNP